MKPSGKFCVAEKLALEGPSPSMASLDIPRASNEGPAIRRDDPRSSELDSAAAQHVATQQRIRGGQGRFASQIPPSSSSIQAKIKRRMREALNAAEGNRQFDVLLNVLFCALKMLPSTHRRLPSRKSTGYRKMQERGP